MSKYFGTDGIRGKAEMFTTEFVARVARGVVDYAGRSEVKVLLGGDTRESTEWILNDLARAFTGMGVECAVVGILPTPALGYCFFEMGFDFAVDVTASHNPFFDNGIKIFERGESGGVKLGAAGVKVVEASIANETPVPLMEPELAEDLRQEAVSRYVEFLEHYIRRLAPEGREAKTDFSGLNIGVDCANGAMGVVGGRMFEYLGAKTTTINADKRYGRRINDCCGSTDLRDLKELVVRSKLDFGVAFDGDGDRCLMVDRSGKEVDGDEILALLAEYLKLSKIVVTVAANQGLFDWAAKRGVEVTMTDVGDQNVAAAMREKGILLGGEQSGHVILPGMSAGDGMLTALAACKALGKRDLAEAVPMKKLPQIETEIEATAEQKAKLTTELSEQLMAEAKEQGFRLLVRPSGTQDLIRIVVWGPDEETMRTFAGEVTEKLRELLN